MTANEKVIIVDAFLQIRDLDNDEETEGTGPASEDDDLMYDLGEFHRAFFNTIHTNLPNELSADIFFGWHRAQMFEMEQTFQDIHPKIGLSYWNSSVDQDLTTLENTLFASDLLGPFDAAWGLNRSLNTHSTAPNTLPTPAEIVRVLAISDYSNNTNSNGSSGGVMPSNDGGFSNQAERGTTHVGVHRWVGGAMSSQNSAFDPVFYFHHSYVDKLWDEWEGNPANNGNSTFALQNMVRYDGTHNFHGNTLPSINPNDLIDTKFYGVFYAENQLVELDDYTVSNTYNSTENFFYQYTIEVGNNFNIPNGTDCEIESVNEIVFEPGFFAESGATFTAKIGDIVVSQSRSDGESKFKYNPFDFKGDINDNAYEGNESLLAVEEDKPITINPSVSQYPNPFDDKFNLNFENSVDNCLVEIFDTTGRKVYSRAFKNSTNLEINNLNHLSSGVYILSVISDNILILNTRIIKK